MTYTFEPFSGVRCTLYEKQPPLNGDKIRKGEVRLGPFTLAWIECDAFVLAMAILEPNQVDAFFVQMLHELQKFPACFTQLRVANLVKPNNKQPFLTPTVRTLAARIFGLAHTALGANLTPLQFSILLLGTDYQLRVWKELALIESGRTSSYSAIANKLGNNGARAVGNAVGANRIVPLIPCHRVIRAGGELSGYRWGSKVKRFLLDAEMMASRGDVASYLVI